MTQQRSDAGGLPPVEDFVRDLLEESMLGHARAASGYPTVPPGYKVACATCGQEVRAQVVVDNTGPHCELPVDSEGSCLDCRRYGIDRSRCPHCHGKPVYELNGEWFGAPRRIVACQQCGGKAEEQAA